MTPTHLNSASREYFVSRLAQLRPDTPRQFGKLTAHGMIVHLDYFSRLSLGRESGPDISNFLTRTRFFRWLVFDVIPTPKGRIKGPDYMTPEPKATFEESRAALQQSLDDFIAGLERDPEQQYPSPLLGPVALREWSHIHALHIRHHLGQFGLP